MYDASVGGIRYISVSGVYNNSPCAPMTFMLTQQRTRTICNPKLIAVFVRLEKFKGPIRLQGCEILSFHWIRETVQIEVIIVRPNFYVNISEQFKIRVCMRPSFVGPINMDL